MQDLSHTLPVAALVGDSSMAATNTVSDEAGSMTAAGSVSESSANVDRGVPMPELPDMTVTTTIVSGQDGTRYEPWRRADGSSWDESTSTDQTPPARSRDQSGRWTQT